MSTDNWHWPQYTILMLFAVSLLAHARDHGKARTCVENFAHPFAAFLILMFLLVSGGFFK